MKSFLAISFLSILALASCNMQNETTFSDRNKGNDRVYGNAGGPPKQLGSKYEADPKSVERIKAIKEKLYPTK